MNMKKTIYTAIATLLFLISSCTLEQEVYLSLIHISEPTRH